MVDSSGDFNAQPFRELLVLDAEILYSFLLFNFLEELGEAIAFDNITAEPRDC